MSDATPAAPVAPQDPFAILSATPGAPVDPLALTPLSAVVPETLTALFETDPSTLDDASLRLLIADLRRRRSAHQSEEAAKQAKGKRASAGAQVDPVTGQKPPIQPKDAALRDGPAEDITLDKLLD